MVNELGNRLRGLMAQVEERVTNAQSKTPRTIGREIQVGITVGYDPATQTESSLDYPGYDADTFWVKLGAPSYTPDDDAGPTTLTVTPYDPPEYRLARSYDGIYHYLGDTVWISSFHDQHYIITSGSRISHMRVPGGISGSVNSTNMASGEAVLYDCSPTGVLTQKVPTRVVTLFNPSQSAIGADKIVIAQRNDAGLWVCIVEDCD